jgi:hypothetical protein
MLTGVRRLCPAGGHAVVVAVGVNGAREATMRRRVGVVEEVSEGSRSRRRGMGLAVAGAAARNGSIRGASIVHGAGALSDGPKRTMTFVVVAHAGLRSEQGASERCSEAVRSRATEDKRGRVVMSSSEGTMSQMRRSELWAGQWREPKANSTLAEAEAWLELQAHSSS